MFVYADPVCPEDSNYEEALDRRVFDSPSAQLSSIADAPAAYVWWDGPDLMFKMPVRVWGKHPAVGLCLGIGPLMFDESGVEMIRAAIALYDAV